ncbi:GDSL-type esterase/lipase family protein [Xylocopilactobacillus apis]|uniref:Lipase/acylhydrolase n=1 Tax=Xylocopilactobacillus apis TaxID=2932183 RepID=A0AAU9D223_9LACO|nr:GDSL-type esterase/lipase family protein [Xylocopilactobacillus apis]BDR56531.1 lipase/acylhydrolase [Xylocopilactobacillus apis]
MQGKKLAFLKAILFFLIICLITFLGLSVFVPRPKNIKQVETPQRTIEYAAIGDSITRGIGDTNKNEGFVGALKDRVETEDHLIVKTHNFGYTGKTSSQIKKRIFSDSNLRKSVVDSKLITLDMGGNDMIYTIQNNFFKLEKKEFIPKAQLFKKNMTESLKELRRLNPKANIIVIGIYNPFYLYFNDIKDLNNLFEEWNNIIVEIVHKNPKTFYQDTNNFINSKSAKKTVDGKIINRYLSKSDDVHPNGLGYSLIANELFNLIKKYKLI